MIETMKKLTFLVYHREYEEFLHRLQELGVMHIEGGALAEGQSDAVSADVAELRRVDALLKQMENLPADKKSAELQAPDATSADCTLSSDSIATLESLFARQADLASREKELAEQVETLTPWGEFDPNEVDMLLDAADGIGISSISDLPDSYCSALADAAHRRGKGLALHASERVREDIESVLALEPDFIVHMCEATDSDLRRCADAGVPAVICASSNIYFGKVPPLKRMCDAGLEFSLGTDNAMLCPPDIMTEACKVAELAQTQGCPELTAVRALADAGNKLLLHKRAFRGKDRAALPAMTRMDIAGKGACPKR
ncbi:MAG: hypothetical protein J6O90_00630 [Candidatus Methanomethylophilaceae archaeon]|nr:hypothetical protein [Candidatus Methanomethylophilaceae archaeon]